MTVTKYDLCKYEKKAMKLFFSAALLSLLPGLGWGANNAEFDFNVKVIEQMCRISIEGTSLNEVDFGNITVSNIEANQVQPIPITITLSDCTTNNFHNAVVKISPKNYIDPITFIDEPSKNFGVSLSERNNVAASANFSDFIEKGSNAWQNINQDQLHKTLYTYIRCPSGKTCDPQIGPFQSTITFSFLVD
ncbi:TPA: type 1 fimbrial protein [Providencia alcalifaciens]|nr:type 1 fimbrial protein [Providencia alcalifaciens]